MSEAFDIEEDEGVDDAAPTPTRYPSVDAWVEEYFTSILQGRYEKPESAGGRTWCACWWDHPPVVAALHELWSAWEAARLATDPAAMSAWHVHHFHPHVRWLCDSEFGPMYRCSPSVHIALQPLPATPAPLGWFDPDPTHIDDLAD